MKKIIMFKVLFLVMFSVQLHAQNYNEPIESGQVVNGAILPITLIQFG